VVFGPGISGDIELTQLLVHFVDNRGNQRLEEGCGAHDDSDIWYPRLIRTSMDGKGDVGIVEPDREAQSSSKMAISRNAVVERRCLCSIDGTIPVLTLLHRSLRSTPPTPPPSHVLNSSKTAMTMSPRLHPYLPSRSLTARTINPVIYHPFPNTLTSRYL